MTEFIGIIYFLSPTLCREALPFATAIAPQALVSMAGGGLTPVN
jgi:hypothetical protein